MGERKILNAISVDIVGPYPPIIGGTASFLSRLVPMLEIHGVSCDVLNTQRGDSKQGLRDRLARLFFFTFLAWKILFSKSEIVHCHAGNWANLIGNTIVLAIGRLSGKALVLTLHSGGILLKLNKYARFGKLIFRIPHVITTVTPELCEMVSKFGNKNVYFVPNGLTYLPNAEEMNQPIPEQTAHFMKNHEPCIVTVGAMEPIYGIDVLILAMPQLLATFPNLGLVVIAYKYADKQYQAKIANLLDSLNLNNYVFFPDSLPSVPAVVKGADVFVRSTIADGDSIAVREALALEVPVVVSNVGYRPEGTLQFNSGDHLHLAAKIKDVLTAPINQRTDSSDAGKRTTLEYIKFYGMAKSKLEDAKAKRHHFTARWH